MEYKNIRYIRFEAKAKLYEYVADVGEADSSAIISVSFPTLFKDRSHESTCHCMANSPGNETAKANDDGS
jgi:hypothetical protein